jgi:hypothetical protein
MSGKINAPDRWTVLCFYVCLERRYHGYVSKGSIKIQSNGVFCVTTRTCLAKFHPADSQVAAFKPHVTIRRNTDKLKTDSDDNRFVLAHVR